MDIIEKVYDYSPIFFQNIMVSTKGYLNSKKRYGKTYQHYLKFYNNFDSLKLEEKKEYQLKEMKKFIKYAYSNSKFYKKFYKGIDIDKINSIDDLKKLPILTKEMLRKNILDINTIKKGVESHTGGTTGKSIEVLFTKEDFMKREAMLANFKNRVGFKNLKMRRATFNGKHIVPPNQNKNKKIFWRKNLFSNQIIYTPFHLTEENYKYYIKSLNKFKPQALDGFFISIYDLASYIERNNIKLSFTPVAIFPTSETMTQSGKELIEKVFKCKVYDQYASSEGAPFITQCKKQNYHIELASGIIEILDNNEILVTSFTTYGTPLIRYRIGDLVVPENNKKCSCGIEGPLINRIEGRKADFLYNPQGAKIGPASNIFKGVPNSIIKGQVIQKKINEIIMKVVIDKERYKEKDDAILRNDVFHKFGKDMNLIIEYVEEIPREKNGKFVLVKNLVKEGK